MTSIWMNQGSVSGTVGSLEILNPSFTVDNLCKPGPSRLPT